MKCPKCEKNERAQGQSYCRLCHAKLAKEKRMAHAKFLLERPKPTEPIKDLAYIPVDPVQIKDQEALPSAPKPSQYQPSPIYWSYYVTKGSDVHKRFLELEKAMVCSLSKQTPPPPH